MIKFGKKILIVAAHPDDEILGVGGSIPLMKQAGATVHSLVVTDGSTTQYQGKQDILEEKHREADRAANIVGVDKLIQWNFPDMRLDSVDHVDLNIALEKLIQEEKYDTVLCQEIGDINKDHREVFQSVSVAVRPHPFQTVNLFMSYYVNSSSEWGVILNANGFKPNVFVDISSTVNLKIDAMAEYKSELRDYPHPRSLEAISNSAKYFGNMVGYTFAEPFRLVFQR